MAITSLSPYYDAYRDRMYPSYEEYRRQEQLMQHETYMREKYAQQQHMAEQQRRVMAPTDALSRYGQVIPGASTPDPKDPLAFLTKADNKLLLTGEAT